MKLHIASDLHLEFGQMKTHPATFDADVIVLVGDIWSGARGIYWARSAWPQHEIVYVAGNHEFYGQVMSQVLSELRLAADETGVYFLENDEVVIQDVRFLGGTLWTDTKLFGSKYTQSTVWENVARLNDFRLIRTSEGESEFSIREMIGLHGVTRRYLAQKLAEPFNGKTVVVTHHAPSWGSVHARYATDLVSAGFASDCTELFGEPLLWCHGHMHDSFDYTEKGTRVICNPRGYMTYSHQNENRHFNPGLIVDI